jgi:hypothetical protein
MVTPYGDRMVKIEKSLDGKTTTVWQPLFYIIPRPQN